MMRRKVLLLKLTNVKSVTVTMSSYPYLDTGNDKKEGEMTETSKQPWCDHRDYMKKRTDILDKSRRF